MHTNCLIEWRPFAGDNPGEKRRMNACLSTSLLIKGPLFTSGSWRDKGRLTGAHFQSEDGGFPPPQSPPSHWNSPHRNGVPEAKVLTGVAQWEANQMIPTPSFFSLSLSLTHNGATGQQWDSFTFRSLICITPFWFRRKGRQAGRRPYHPFIIFRESGLCLLPVGKSLVYYKYW